MLEKEYEITVAIAAPIPPNLGINIRLRNILHIAPPIDRYIEYDMSPSFKNHWLCATPKNTNMVAQACINKMGAASE